MTLRRAALYAGGASLLVAWLSSAASLSLSNSRAHTPGVREPEAQAVSSVEEMAAQVQQQARRLRERLPATPQEEPPVRNPFQFRERTRPEPRTVVATSSPPIPPAPAEPPEPALTLVGVAEHHHESGAVRTALLVTGGDQMLMVTAGESVLGRYTVTAVTADAVELADQATGRTRRLALDVP